MWMPMRVLPGLLHVLLVRAMPMVQPTAIVLVPLVRLANSKQVLGHHLVQCGQSLRVQWGKGIRLAQLLLILRVLLVVLVALALAMIRVLATTMVFLPVHLVPDTMRALQVRTRFVLPVLPGNGML
jgi:hypothetical protein